MFVLFIAPKNILQYIAYLNIKEFIPRKVRNESVECLVSQIGVQVFYKKYKKNITKTKGKIIVWMSKILMA